MARTPAKTATRTQEGTSTRRRRLSRLDAAPGETLTSAEENVMRMHHGLESGLHTPLPSNAINAAIRQQLLEIELRAYQATGRYMDRLEEMEAEAEESEPKEPAPRAATKSRSAAKDPKKEKIVSRLKKR